MNITKMVLYVLAIAFGIFMFIFGGYDDSPGAQGIGALLFIFGVVKIFRNRR